MPIRDPVANGDRSATIDDSKIDTQPVPPKRPDSSDATTPFRRDSGFSDEPTVNVSLAPVTNDDFKARSVERSVLGEGGMGQVRLCADRRIGRDVAVKVILGSAQSQPELGLRFEREARIQGQLEHPSIVPVYDMGVSDDGAFFSMRRVNGHTLEEIIDRLAAEESAFVERFTRRKLVTAFNQLALAVAFAHSRGVVHRDLKPANVMLGDFGEVYVLDWGLAQLITDADVDARKMTRPGIVMGTPGYMSPEQVVGQTPDARSDVYALGAILFELLAYSPLHPFYTPGKVAAATLNGSGSRPSVRAPGRGISAALDAVCVRATAASPLIATPRYSNWSPISSATSKAIAIRRAGSNSPRSTRASPRMLQTAQSRAPGVTHWPRVPRLSAK